MQEPLEELLVEEIKDLYSAENQLVKALPKMAAAAQADDLRSAFEGHLAETRAQVTRLEKAAELLEAKPGGKTCKGMEGLITEGAEAIREHQDSPVLDLALIAAASRVEHYEIAGYTSAMEIARSLGRTDVLELLSESFEEEGAAEEALREQAASAINAAPGKEK
jgi:ferritin-like metal-binding protein YciE